MGLLIDTSALVMLERAGSRWESLAAAVADEPLAMPAVVYAEALAGVFLADTVERAVRRRAKLDALAARVPVIEFDRQIADVWADLSARLSRSGVSVPSNDLAVAATALHLDCGVCVGPSDEKIFRAIPGLRVVVLSSRSEAV